MKKRYGLIGFPLSHSFSKKYFTEKFARENISDCEYELYELADIQEFSDLVHKTENLCGINVTIPYKRAVMPFLDDLHEAARRIGAVNVIKFEDGKLIGYNSDYFGFKQSLLNLLAGEKPEKALILGTGGASGAICTALEDLEIPFTFVSRSPAENRLTYAQIGPEILAENRLIINTSPVGMSPKNDTFPALPYEGLSNRHFLYDLVYNPKETVFMKKGISAGAKVCNGLEMLHLQAIKSWEIWNREG